MAFANGHLPALLPASPETNRMTQNPNPQSQNDPRRQDQKDPNQTNNPGQKQNDDGDGQMHGDPNQKDRAQQDQRR